MFSNPEFLERYHAITPNKYKTYSNAIIWGRGDLWAELQQRIGNPDLLKDQVNFIWFAFNLSLISKSIFSFSRQNYKFCELYIESVCNNIGLYGIFNKIYRREGKLLVDMYRQRIPIDLAEIFKNTSIDNLEKYTTALIEAFRVLDREACLGKLDYAAFLSKIIHEKDFQSEFSENTEELSFKYFELLSKKVAALHTQEGQFIQPEQFDQSKIYKILTSFKYKTEGDKKILSRFLESFPAQNKLFYPSSNADINDIFHINEERIFEIRDFSPVIFIHSDLAILRENSEDYYRIFQEENTRSSFSFSSPFKITTGIDRHINIFEISRPNIQDKKWLIHFGGYSNEEVLALILRDRIRVSILYSSCDGITSGCVGTTTYSIPTIFYPFLYKQLGIRFHITTDDIKYIVYTVTDRDAKETRAWLKNILKITEIDLLRSLLKEEDESMKEQLILFLTDVLENNINTRSMKRVYYPDYLKLRVIP